MNAIPKYTVQFDMDPVLVSFVAVGVISYPFLSSSFVCTKRQRGDRYVHAWIYAYRRKKEVQESLSYQFLVTPLMRSNISKIS
jgi:hypothetical protein